MDAADSLNEEAARQIVELGNELADRHPDADLWSIADGLLAGAIHWWLYANQPCGDMSCEECAPICTAGLRMHQLKALLAEFAETSEYYHSPNDQDVARA